MNRKSKPEHWLYNLPEDRAADIAEHARTNKLVDTVAWLRADGHKTSRSALSRWLHWWRSRQVFTQAESSANDFKEWLATEFPELPEAELDKRASLMFQAEAMKAGDPETYLAFSTARHKAVMDVAKLEQRERALTLNREKFELEAAEKMLSAALRAKADEINSSGLSQAEKIAAMRREAFKGVDELQASGKVKIPKS